jgi:signal transduction histidine kinase
MSRSLEAKQVDESQIDSDLAAFFQHMKEYLDFGEVDEHLISETGNAFRNNITLLVDDFYRKQISYTTTSRLFPRSDGNPTIETQKKKDEISQFLLNVIDSRQDIHFAQNVERIFENLSADLKTDSHYIVGALSFFEERISSFLLEYLPDGEKSYKTKAVNAWIKFFNLTLAIILRKYVKSAYVSEIEAKTNALKKNKRTLELLHDILTHDIANYNLVVRMSAELLQSNLLKDNASKEENMSLLKAILKATGDSMELVAESTELGEIALHEPVELFPVNLVQSLHDATDFVVKSHSERKVAPAIVVNSSATPYVRADNSLVNAFTNILANAVIRSHHDPVAIDIRVDEPEIERGFWKIRFVDYGEGMDDDAKDRVFIRYTSPEKGSGLGLSMAYALIVDRYSGKLTINDRVNGDHRQGAVVDVLLRRN